MAGLVVILQTDKYLRPKIQQYGCYFMCLLFMVNKLTGKHIDTRTINDWYDYFQTRKWMDKDCFVERPVDILNYLGLKVNSVRFEGADYQCLPGEIEILRFERSYKKDGRVITYGHFVCGSGSVVGYDPGGCSNAVKYGTLESKRVYK